MIHAFNKIAYFNLLRETDKSGVISCVEVNYIPKTDYRSVKNVEVEVLANVHTKIFENVNRPIGMELTDGLMRDARL